MLLAYYYSGGDIARTSVGLLVAKEKIAKSVDSVSQDVR